MNSKMVILFVLLVACLASTAWADGKFFGTISYRNCTCREASGGDAVHIWQNGGISDYWNIVCDHFIPTGTYSTDDTYPAGWYYLAVDLADGTDCDQAVIKYIYHGTSDHRVDLEVKGPGGEPTGGGEN